MQLSTRQKSDGPSQLRLNDSECDTIGDSLGYHANLFATRSSSKPFATVKEGFPEYLPE